jgi:hypothetical protein
MKGVTRAIGCLAAFLLLFGAVDAGQKTEKFWNDLLRKYPGESLVCLLDDVVVDVEYTGEVARRDVSDTERGGLEASREATLALGSRYTTINRYSKQYAILNEAGAAAMSEYVVPYLAGQSITHHSMELVDRTGKKLPVPAEMIEVVSAYPNEAEVYKRVKNLVFHVENPPIPSVVTFHYTIEGEEAYGYQDRVFAPSIPTYRMDMSYNFPQSYVMQNAWWQNSLKQLNAVDPAQKTISSATGEMFQWIWQYKNLKPVKPEPFSPALGDLQPRIRFSPNFEANWTKLVDWYAAGVNLALAPEANVRVVSGATREAIESFEAARNAELEKLRAATPPPVDTSAAAKAAVTPEGGAAATGAAPADTAAVAAPPPPPPLTEEEKITAIYQYVQEHYEAIDLGLGRDGFFPNPPADVFAITRLAPKDIAGILIVMLRAAEIDADFAITATRDFGEVRAEFPALSQFNRGIVLARAGEQIFFLDPGDKSAGIVDPPAAIEGQIVVPIHIGRSDMLTVPQSTNARNSWTIAGGLERDAEGAFHMKTDVTCRGELNRVFRDKFYAHGSEAGTEARRIWLGQNFPKGSSTGPWNDARGLTKDDDYTFGFDLRLPKELVEERGDTLVLSGALFGMMTPVQLFSVPENRALPLRLQFEERGEERISFRLPEGYEIVSLPKELAYQKPFGRVTVSYSRGDGAVECLYEYSIEETDKPVAAMNQVKEYFEQFGKNAEQKIVLRKVPVEGGA